LSVRIALLSSLALLLLAGCGSQSSAPGNSAAKASPSSFAKRGGTHHYEYVFPDQAMYVYDIDHRHRLVEHRSLPGITGIRGVGADIKNHMLYISHGGDGGSEGNGSLLKYDLLTDRIVWDRRYSTGIDSFAISRDGSRIYMPDGELTPDGIWLVLNADSGNVIGRIDGGTGPHNTVVGLSGRYVYLGGRNYNYLEVASTASNQVIRKIGPLRSGVRPFTINGRETLAYTTATGFLGFQVSSIRSGHVLYTETFGPRFPYDPSTFPASAPSHGISLSPDERRLWVLDSPNGYVHVFDVSRLPRRAPRRIADIKLAHGERGDEAGCSYDCLRDGWLQTSLNGCFVYVGDSGDVLSARTLRPVAFLRPLRNTRKMLEIDWRKGAPVATSTRSGLGYVTGKGRGPRPACR
jgi:DNA-binding beta-propeller fold protein YncE